MQAVVDVGYRYLGNDKYKVVVLLKFPDGDTHEYMLDMPPYYNGNVILDLHRVLDELKFVNLQRAYLNLCIYMEDILTLDEFDKLHGLEVDISDEFGLYLCDSGIEEVEDDDPRTNIQIAEDYFQGKPHKTEPDKYTGQQWVVEI